MSTAVIYSNAVKLKATLQEDLSLLVSGQDTSIQSKIRAALSDLRQIINELELYGKREVTQIKREATLGRASQLKMELDQMQITLDKFKQQEQLRIQQEQRQALLDIPTDSSLNQRHAAKEESTILMMDAFISKENEALGNAGQSVEQYIAIGRNALQELYEQRSILKNTQRRLLDVANQLGLSSTVIRFIEQRTQADQWILYGGIVVTVLLMWAIIHYLG